MAGTLFVVATPIGNLEDLTFRALRTLREVDLIAAEDTRRTAKLLAHYEIKKPLVSLREHNENRETPRLLDLMAAGQNIALVSDAGTPAIADPGARLVRAAHERRLPVVPVPGASAVVSALSVSGFGGEEFVFLGFPPSSGSARKQWFETLTAEKRVVVFFEAPHRIHRTIDELSSQLVNRPIMLARELTKRFEELVMWPNNLASDITSLGEFTVVVGLPSTSGQGRLVDADAVVKLFGRLTDSGAFDRDEAVNLVAAATGEAPKDVAKIIKKHKISVDRQNKTTP